MADIFISYKRDERESVEFLADELRELGFGVWFDASMTAGDAFNDEIEREARGAKVILVCWSPSARESRWVKAEAMIGFEQDKLAAIYVAGPDAFVPPAPFNTTHAEDLREWLKAPDIGDPRWRSLLRRIGKLCGRGDIEDWCALGARPSLAALRHWLETHGDSPLRASVEAFVNVRAGQEDAGASWAEARLAAMTRTWPWRAELRAWRDRIEQFVRGHPVRATLAATALFALVALGGFLGWPRPEAVLMLRPSRDVRAVVFTLQAPAGHAELDILARSVTNEIVDTLHQIGIETASVSETAERRSIAQRGRSLGATFTLDGELIPEGDLVRASMRLSDVNRGQVLWAQTFERSSARAPALRLEVASVTVAVMQCAVEARRGTPEFTPQTLSKLLRSCELSLDVESEEERRLLEQLAHAVPDSSLVQGRLAELTYLAASLEPPGDRREELEQQARAAADTALRFDPANGEALMVKTNLSTTLSRAERETALLSALRRAPDSPDLNRSYATFLRTHGRPAEAIEYLRRALAREPLSPDNVRELAFTLASVGSDREAISILTDSEARWPGNEELWSERFRVNLWFGSPGDALRMLDEAPSAFSTTEIQCSRLAATALVTNTDAARRRVAQEARECWPRDPFLILAALGDVDAAFAASESMLAGCHSAPASSPAPSACIRGHPWRVYFYPMAASMRRDSRFMPLMRRAGLVQYWLETDRWPEFCDDPDLPYDCREQARSVSAAASPR